MNLVNTPTLETDRLILRKFTKNDRKALFAIYSDEEVNTYLPWFPLKSVEEAEALFEEKYESGYQQPSGYMYAVCLKSDNLPIGYIHVDTGDSYDLGYGLRREFWHKGIVTEAAKAVAEQLKSDGIPYITATHDVKNPRSGGVMKQMGMKYQYSYEEQWQPKDILVTFRMYQLNFDGQNDRVYKKYWNRYPVHFIEIMDFEAPELDVYARFSEVQLLRCREPERGIFIAESPKVIARALSAGCVPISFLAEQKQIETEGEAKEILSRWSGVPLYTAEFDVLTRLTGFKLTRGMLCAMYRPELPTVEEVCAGARRIAILENVVNPTNVGAIFRSAAALNIDGVLLTNGCSDPLYRRSARVSMGNVFQIPWAFLDREYAWPQPCISRLHELGFKTAAMALDDDSVRIDDPQLMAEDKLAIVLGTEGDGLASGTIADCDYTVRIPMSNDVDSLNVAAASAVAFWQLGNRKI